MSQRSLYKFKLYVAGNTPNSAQAKVNLNALCRKYLNGRYRIEIVDVVRHPDRALTDGVYMTPALHKLAPLPLCTIVGTLSSAGTVLSALGLTVAEDGYSEVTGERS